MRTLSILLKRLIWSLLPVPKDPRDRDLALMERAAAVLDVYHDGIRPTPKGYHLARRILSRHSMPAHALRSMTRERDADLIAQATLAQDQIAATDNQQPSRATS